MYFMYRYIVETRKKYAKPEKLAYTSLDIVMQRMFLLEDSKVSIRIMFSLPLGWPK